MLLDQDECNKGDEGNPPPPPPLSTSSSFSATIIIATTTTATTIIVEQTRELARRILKEAGRTMEKNKARDGDANDFGDGDASSAMKMLASDGIHYYCWFTAITAECGEYLGDYEMARLAYKNVQAMKDRHHHHKRVIAGNFNANGGVYGGGDNDNGLNYKAPMSMSTSTSKNIS